MSSIDRSNRSGELVAAAEPHLSILPVHVPGGLHRIIPAHVWNKGERRPVENRRE